jgi:hypothetical protein
MLAGRVPTATPLLPSCEWIFDIVEVGSRDRATGLVGLASESFKAEQIQTSTGRVLGARPDTVWPNIFLETPV